MANRPLIAETKLAVGSLIPGVPFLVFDEQVYTGITDSRADAIISSNEVRGAHNVASDSSVRGLRNLTLHQIRMKNAGDAALRPSWSAVDAAELDVQADAALAVTKRDKIYASFVAPLSAVIGQSLNSLSASLHRDAIAFDYYMYRRGLIMDARGRIALLAPTSQAPKEYHYILDLDLDDWLVVSLNPAWAAFIV